MKHLHTRPDVTTRTAEPWAVALVGFVVQEVRVRH
jgi:hypothetical protein